MTPVLCDDNILSWPLCCQSPPLASSWYGWSWHLVIWILMEKVFTTWDIVMKIHNLTLNSPPRSSWFYFCYILWLFAPFLSIQNVKFYSVVEWIAVVNSCSPINRFFTEDESFFGIRQVTFSIVKISFWGIQIY